MWSNGCHVLNFLTSVAFINCLFPPCADPVVLGCGWVCRHFGWSPFAASGKYRKYLFTAELKCFHFHGCCKHFKHIWAAPRMKNISGNPTCALFALVTGAQVVTVEETFNIFGFDCIQMFECDAPLMWGSHVLLYYSCSWLENMKLLKIQTVEVISPPQLS